MIESNLRNLKIEAKLYKKAEAISPLFSSNEKALYFYTKKLEDLASTYNKSVDELIIWAERDQNYSDDITNILSLHRKVQVLRQI